MGANKQLLTTKEFADQSGLPVSKVTKFLRDGRLKGQKKSGKWMIPASELDPYVKPADPPQKPSVPEAQVAAAVTAPQADRNFSVAEFSAMTYLTEHGVRKWLKAGKLKGTQAENGEWQVDAASLEDPNIKRLVR
jgi:hypothetical protein